MEENKLHWAITGQHAAEIISLRAGISLQLSCFRNTYPGSLQNG